MKPMLWAVLMFLAGALPAGEAVATSQSQVPPPPYRASFIGGFWFGAPESINKVNVNGVKLGLPISAGHGEVNGFEWAFFCAATDHICGFQWGIAGASVSNDMHGFQMSIVTSTQNDLKGMQMGIVNLGDRKGFQLGIVNYADNVDCQIGLVNLNKHGWMPFMVGFNHSK